MADRDDARGSPREGQGVFTAPPAVGADEAWVGGTAARAADASATPPRASPRSPSRPPPSPGRLPPGTHLNDAYEVNLRLSRGGMGEVYEGVEIQSGNRVAIKVILEHLADDPVVESMLRVEAVALSRLTSDALVKYRALMRDRSRNVLYLVMDFVEGRTLDDLIGEIRPSQRAFKALMRRLAEGLTAAHARGIFHRDISPDNILLPDGDLNAATIIDFGIAKDTQTVQATIIGAGFAGKLNYVAPEQLGDYERRIGPWTDIYSLGLVMLCVAAGDIVNMGAHLADAVDRRRVLPDLSPLPPSLQPVFARMLAPRPDDRFQTMAELIAALDQIPDYPTLAPTSATPPPSADATIMLPPGSLPLPPARTPPQSAPPQPSAFTSTPPQAAPPSFTAPPGHESPPYAAPYSTPPEAPRSYTAPPAHVSTPPTPIPTAAPSPTSIPHPFTSHPGAAPTGAAPARPSGARPATGNAARQQEAAARGRRLLLVGGSVAGVLALGVVGLLILFGGGHKPTPATNTTVAGGNQTAAPTGPAGTQTAVLEGAIRQKACSWLSYDTGPNSIVLKGVAPGGSGDIGDIQAALSQGGFGSFTLNADTTVKPTPPADCQVLTSLAAYAAPGADWISAQSPTTSPPGLAPCDPAKALEAIDVDMAGGNAAVWELPPSGKLQVVPASQIQTGGARARVDLCESQPGLYGVVVVHGQGPFDPSNLSAGASRGWQMQMTWFEVTPPAPGSATTAAGPPPAGTAAPTTPPTTTHATPTPPRPTTTAHHPPPPVHHPTTPHVQPVDPVW